MRRTFRGYLRVLRKPAFRRFWLGMMVSRCGSAFTVVALSWLVLDLAGPRELGLVLLCSGLPILVCGPVAGRLLDRFPVRLLLGWDNAVRGVLIALLPVLDYFGQIRVVHICVVGAVSAALAAVSEVAEGVLVPRVVEDADLESANSLLSVNWELAYVVGPPVAGFLVGTAGVSTALVVDAASFAIMSWFSFRLPDLRAPAREERGRPAFVVLARHPTALLLTACAAGFLFLSGATDLLYPVYALKVLHDSAFAFGVLLGAAGAGGLCGVLCGLPLFLRLPVRARLPVVIAGGAPALAALTLTDALPVAAVLVAVASFLWGPYYAIERSLFQRSVPDDVRGQVTGARAAVCALGFPLGSAAGGMLFSGPVSAGVIALAIAYLVLATLPLIKVRPELRRGAHQRAPACSRHACTTPALKGGKKS
ncbi:MFS transporter [Lentzea sp. BCCO 10_0798]|uniref:MFS transporter n=1 Tax=Lentzea kristufekii TaxID=3095430 RepID=A0ABU4TZD3_9PSEU|nr:MFS transporter [Lentzea sp. BCCO 10_0798]MDX8053680.1 MFS transporter [Lentzea sp. BCCO 10_0798]